MKTRDRDVAAVLEAWPSQAGLAAALDWEQC